MVPRREIVQFNQILPNWHFKMEGLMFKAGFVDTDLKVELVLRELAIFDYTRQCEKTVAVPYALDSIKTEMTSLSKLL